MRNIPLVGLVALVALAGILALGLAACGTGAGGGPGLQTTDIVVGDGVEAQPGDIVTIHYIGRLEDGTEFDTTIGGDPLRTPLNRAIPGMTEGIPGMKVGGTRELIIPPSLAFGSLGGQGGAVPPNATVTYEVELVGAEPRPTPTPDIFSLR